MGTASHSYKSTYDLLRGLRGLISTVIIRVISAMNPQVDSGPRPAGPTIQADPPFDH